MRPLARVAVLRCGLLFGACLFLAAESRAADSVPRPAQWATLELRDGRVLHNVKLMSDEPNSVVVRADEGLVKVAKSNLPQPVAALYPVKAPPPASQKMMMQPFDPNPNPTDAVRSMPPVGKQRAEQQGRAFKGCTIVRFQMKEFPSVLGCAQVVIRNDTGTPADIVPGDIVCITTSGTVLFSHVMLTEGDPPGRKRKETVPPYGEVEVILAFSNGVIEISGVQWAK